MTFYPTIREPLFYTPGYITDFSTNRKRATMLKKILVIEDDFALRQSIQELLESEGFQTVGAANGRTGIEFAHQHLPHLIISDIQMPDIDGYDVLGALQKSSITATIPFIFLTARSSKSDLRQGMEQGADDYLIKPCTADELLKAIDRRLSKQTLLTNQAQQQLDCLRNSIARSLPHELQAPIAATLTSVEVLRLIAGSAQPDEILEMADVIQTATARLSKLVQNFLLYAELELAAHQAQPSAHVWADETLNSEQIITEVATQIAQQMQRVTDLKLTLHRGTAPLSQSHLSKIIAELTDNAFKFSLPGTPIQIDSTWNGQQFILDVMDCGRGFSPEQIQNIGAYIQFDRHIQEQQGLGLGLSIVKRLVERYQGTLTIESRIRQWTQVRLVIPNPDTN